MEILEIHDTEIISIPNFPSTKQKQKNLSERIPSSEMSRFEWLHKELF